MEHTHKQAILNKVLHIELRGVSRHFICFAFWPKYNTDRLIRPKETMPRDIIYFVFMSMEYLCMLALRGTMGSCLAGGTWPQKSGKGRMLNPGIDLVWVATARYSWGSWCGIQAPCLFNNMSIMVHWGNSSPPSCSSVCSFPLRPGAPSPLWEKSNNKIKPSIIKQSEGNTD